MNKDQILSLIDREIDENCRPWVLACFDAYEGEGADFSRAAALGCLRHLAVKAHGAFDIHVQMSIAPRMEGATTRWRTVDRQGRLLRHGGVTVPLDDDPMAHALVAALVDAVIRRTET